MRLNYFWQPATGLNADIERHRVQEKEIRDKISELEELNDEKYDRYLKVERYFLGQLLQSKADVVDQLGRKKK